MRPPGRKSQLHIFQVKSNGLKLKWMSAVILVFMNTKVGLQSRLKCNQNRCRMFQTIFFYFLRSCNSCWDAFSACRDTTWISSHDSAFQTKCNLIQKGFSAFNYAPLARLHFCKHFLHCCCAENIDDWALASQSILHTVQMSVWTSCWLHAGPKLSSLDCKRLIFISGSLLQGLAEIKKKKISLSLNFHLHIKLKFTHTNMYVVLYHLYLWSKALTGCLIVLLRT